MGLADFLYGAPGAAQEFTAGMQGRREGLEEKRAREREEAARREREQLHRVALSTRSQAA